MACSPGEGVSSVLLGTTGTWPPHSESGFAWSEPPFLQNLNTEAQEGQGYKRAWGWSHPLGKTHPNAVNHPRACRCQISSLPRGQAPWYVSPSRTMPHMGSLSVCFVSGCSPGPWKSVWHPQGTPYTQLLDERMPGCHFLQAPPSLVVPLTRGSCGSNSHRGGCFV